MRVGKSITSTRRGFQAGSGLVCLKHWRTVKVAQREKRQWWWWWWGVLECQSGEKADQGSGIFRADSGVWTVPGRVGVSRKI